LSHQVVQVARVEQLLQVPRELSVVIQLLVQELRHILQHMVVEMVKEVQYLVRQLLPVVVEGQVVREH
jgi:hypothetical protein